MKVIAKSITPKRDPIGTIRADSISKALDRLTANILADFAKTVKTWSNKPDFVVEDSRRGGNFRRAIYTTSAIYGYVNDGTRAHLIRPKNGKALSFQSGYRAKTRVGLIGSNSGGASGAYVQAKAVRHPGTDARNFTRVIAAKHRRTIRGIKVIRDRK